MKKLIAFGSASGLMLTPFLALAQTGSQIYGILNIVRNILNIVVPILITLGIIYFIAGVIKYVTAKDEDAQKEGRTMIISGIIGLFVIVSIWGLIRFLGTATGVDQGYIDCVVNPQGQGC